MNFIAYDGGCFNPKDVAAVYIDDDNEEHSIVSLTNGDKILLGKPMIFIANLIANVANENVDAVIAMLCGSDERMGEQG